MTAVDPQAAPAAMPSGVWVNGQVRLVDVAGSRLNNFDSLRLIAAMMVVVDHSFPIQGQPHFLADTLGTTLGGLAVWSFFAMSGFLITKSWIEDPNAVRFVWKRALRLMPAFIVAVLFCALVVGAIATDLSFGDYLHAPATWSFVKHNVVMWPITYSLPGVFQHNPYPGAVNGSLWSLPIEVLAYGVVLALGITGLLRRRGAVVALLAGALYVNWHLISNGWLGGGVWMGMPVVQLWDLLSVFLIGSLYYLFRERIVLSWKIALALIALYVVSIHTSYVGIVFYLLVPYLLMTIAYMPLPRLKALARPGDVSYGVYIYAFPVQQLFANWYPSASPWTSTLVAAPVTYVLAYASWRVIEKPALGLKRLVGRKRVEAARSTSGVEPAR